MTFDPQHPYNDLPRLPPATELESRTVLKACIPARAERLPNQIILITSLPLLKAKDRSESE